MDSRLSEGDETYQTHNTRTKMSVLLTKLWFQLMCAFDLLALITSSEAITIIKRFLIMNKMCMDIQYSNISTTTTHLLISFSLLSDLYVLTRFIYLYLI